MGKLKVLVLGDGLLGSEIVRQTGWDCRSRKKGNFDLFNMAVTAPVEYDVVINCIANTDTYSTDARAHMSINFDFVERLITHCNKYNIKLVHISTDYIYAGSESNASEDSVPVHANNWYSYSKLLADAWVQKESRDFLLCRCTHKPNPFPYAAAWTNQVGNFDYVDVIARIIIRMINRDMRGVYNVGTETKTMFELASKTAKIGQSLAPDHVPKDTSMNINKMLNDLYNPFFSIAIPTYGYGGKGAEFLDDNFRILSEQTFKDFEVVISDHSIDDTILDVVRKWQMFLDIKYVRNEHGRGIISPNINNAMKLCNGKWIKVLFQDDFLYDQDSLKIQNYTLMTKPYTKWLMTKFYHSNDGKTFYRLYHPVWNDFIWTGNNTMGCPSGMTIRNEDIIFFDEGLNWLMDCDYYQKMFQLHGQPEILNTPTVVNRTWGNRLTDTIGQELKDKEFRMLTERYAQPR